MQNVKEREKKQVPAIEAGCKTEGKLETLVEESKHGWRKAGWVHVVQVGKKVAGGEGIDFARFYTENLIINIFVTNSWWFNKKVKNK